MTMMQSVALSDSNVLELDKLSDEHDRENTDYDTLSGFVLVPSFEAKEAFQVDEDEYDYCEDVLSDALAQESEPGFNLTEDMILEEAADEPSIQHILDDAHKQASKLIAIQQKGPGNAVPAIESSASKAPVGTCSQSTIGYIGFSSESKPQEEEEPASDLPKSPEKETASPSSNAEKISPSQETALSSKIGRIPNKKRRKKMKMLKKAAAAAKAAANISAAETSSVNSGNSNQITAATAKKKNSAKSKNTVSVNASSRGPASRYYNKRVASIAAVACATESLATYKAEIHNKKVH